VLVYASAFFFLPFFLQNARKVKWRPEDGLLLLFLAWTAVCTIFSVYPAGSFSGYYRFYFQGFLAFFSVTVLYFLPRFLSGEDKEKFPRLLIWVPLVPLLYGLVQYFRLDIFPWEGQPYPRIWSFFGNPDFFASFLGFFFPLLLSALASASTRKEIVLYGVYFCLFLFVLIQTHTRAVWVGSSAALIVWLLLQERSRRRILIPWIAAGILAAGLVLMLFLPDIFSGFGKRFVSIFDLTEENIRMRILGYRAALQMVRGHLLTGSGLDTYLWRFRAFVPLEFLAGSRSMTHAGYAHNQLLQFLVDTGAVGLGLYIILFACFICRGIRDSLGLYGRERMIVSSFPAAVFGTFVSGLFSFYPIASLAYLYIFWGWMTSRNSPGYSSPSGRTVWIFSAVLALSALLPFAADVKFKKGMMRQDEKEVYRALRLNPFPDFYRVSLGKILREKGRIAEAESVFREAAARNPYNALAWNGWGVVKREEGNEEEAAALFQKALLHDPHLSAAWLNLAVAYEKQGDFTRALEAYEEALKLDESSQLAYFNSGVIYANRKDYARAREEWKKLENLNSGYPRLRGYLQFLDKLIE